MARVSSASYRRVPRGEGRTQWFLAKEGTPLHPLPAFLPEWDPQVDVEVLVRAGIRRDEIELHTGLDSTADIHLGISWHSRGTQVKGSSPLLPMDPSAEVDSWELRCKAPGQQLGGEVRFRVVAILGSPWNGDDPLSPKRVGSVLWEEDCVLSLQGVGGRFPMTWIDFPSSPAFPDGAAWSLDWDPDSLEEDLLRGTRLYLNSAHPVLRAAVEDPDAQGSVPVLEMLHFDIGRTLLCGALANPHFCEHPEDYELGTVGRALLGLLRATFPGHRAADLAHRMRREPARFERELQHGLRILQALAKP